MGADKRIRPPRNYRPRFRIPLHGNWRREPRSVNRDSPKDPFSAAPSRARRIVKPGDTIISTVRTYLKAIWYAENPGDDLVCSTGFAVLTPPKGANSKFINYLIQSEPFTDRVTAESVGTAYPQSRRTNWRLLRSVYHHPKNKPPSSATWTTPTSASGTT